jgi:hypothetical protein
VKHAPSSVALVVALLLCACSSVHRFERPPSDADLQRIGSEVAGGAADIKLGSAAAVPVGGLHAEGGRLSWTSPDPGGVPADQLREVTILRRGKGFWEGAAIGAGAGFLAGLVTGVVWQTSCSAGPVVDNEQLSSCPLTTYPSFSKGLQLGAIMGLLFALPAGIVGGVAGAALGDRTTFKFDAEPRY